MRFGRGRSGAGSSPPGNAFTAGELRFCSAHCHFYEPVAFRCNRTPNRVVYAKRPSAGPPPRRTIDNAHSAQCTTDQAVRTRRNIDRALLPSYLIGLRGSNSAGMAWSPLRSRLMTCTLGRRRNQLALFVDKRLASTSTPSRD